jgi:hypothetical protein
MLGKPSTIAGLVKVGNPALGVFIGVVLTGRPEPVVYAEYTDGTETWRIGVRDGEMVWDYTITALGFNGVESADGITGDWYNPKSLS